LGLDEILVDAGWDLEQAMRRVGERLDPRENPTAAGEEQEALEATVFGALAQMLREETVKW
jgi:hypothetical protein